MTVKIEKRKNTVAVAAVILCAVSARAVSKLGLFTTPMGLIRTMLYILLYFGWCVSIQRRVIQSQTRRYLTAIPMIMIFWLIVRSLKYYFVSDTAAIRQLWYWYYFSMLFIPLLSVFVSMSLGKPEDFKLSKKMRLLYIPTFLFLLLVVTNDLHRWVFSFPTGEVWSDKNVHYEPLYFLVVGWEIVCAVVAMVVILAKSRYSYRNKYLPVAVLMFAIVYAAIYVSGVRWMQVIAGDLTAAQCLMFAAVLESCIQCGLIPTNTGYDALFETGSLKAQITDMDGAVRYASANAPKLPPEAVSESYNGPVDLDKNTRLKSNPIPGGHVLWVEDITAIRLLLEELEENQEAVAESNHLEAENYNTKRRISALREKNRLYDLLQEQTSKQIDLLDSYLTLYGAESGENERRKLLAKAAVVGAYIKRRGNLMFIGEKSEITDTSELSLCLKESFDNLELAGVECAIDIPERIAVRSADAIKIYDFFEAVVETAIDSLRSVWLKARSSDGYVIFHIEAECAANLSGLSEFADTSDYETEVWCFTLRINKESDGR